MSRKLMSILLALLLLSGCGFGTQLSERAVAQVLAIDREGDGYRVSFVEASDPVSGKGETIADAVSALEQDLGKKLFLRDVRLILLGETLCDDGIEACMRYLTGGFSIRPRAMLAAVQGTAAQYLSAADKVSEVLQRPGNNMTILALDRDSRASGGDGYLPLLTMDAHTPHGGIILRHEKTSCRVWQEAADDMKLLLREADGETMVLTLDDGQAVIRFADHKKHLRARRGADTPTFDLFWRGTFELVEWTGKADSLPDEETLEKAVELAVTKRLENALRTTVFIAEADLLQLQSVLRRDGYEGEYDPKASVFYPSVRCRLRSR